ncbi:hypothetical protein KY362_01365 [Candidatus Woesearchaeota archaeon]|nr:hypothetical protein [Candidatus Woesearchaeota archaeon]
MTKRTPAKQTSRSPAKKGKSVPRAIQHGREAAARAKAALAKAGSKLSRGKGGKEAGPVKTVKVKHVLPAKGYPKSIIHKELHKQTKVTEKIERPPHELSEEFFVPSPIHRGKYRIPVGIKFLIGYLLFLSVLYLISFISGITFPTSILFGKMITGARAMFINVVLLMIILLVVFGFWRRKAYAFDLSIGFFSFAALNAFISLVLFESAEHPIFRQLLLLSFVSLVLMNIVIVWYVLHEKKYFFVERFKDRPWHQRDRIFLYTLITFWAVVLMIGVTLGSQFYTDTKAMIDENIADISHYGPIACNDKTGPDKDVCSLVVATALSGQRSDEELNAICGSIESDFYQFTCRRSIATPAS